MADINAIFGNPIVLDTSGIKDEAVTTEKVSDGAITLPKLAGDVNIGAITDVVGRSVVAAKTALRVVAGKYIKTNQDVGQSVSLTPTSGASMEYTTVKVSSDDVLFVTGEGGNAARLWAFIDADGKMLSKSDENVTASGLMLVPPTGADIAIFNSYVGEGSFLIGKGVASVLDGMNHAIKPALRLNADDFTFGASSYSSGNISYLFTNRNRVRTKYVLHDSSVSVTADSGYQFAIHDGSGWYHQFTGASTYEIASIRGQFGLVLRKSDSSDIEDIDEFLSHFDIQIYTDRRQYIKPDDGVIHFKVPVNIASQSLDSTLDVEDSFTQAYDDGILVLPPNYSDSGEPCRLAIVCHGAGTSDYSAKTMDNTGKILPDPQRVLTKMGYAVMDMYASPTALSGGSELHYGNPVALQCYVKGYEYVRRFFNVKPEIFVSGSSMGGLTSFDIVNGTGIPVLAQAGFCPCVDLFKQAWCNPWSSPASQRENIADLYGFTGTEPTWTSSKYPSGEEIQYFEDNVGKTIGYYPMLHGGTGTDFDSLASVAPSSATSADAQEAALYAELSVFHRVPLKIWHCVNDSTMSYRYSTYLVDAMRRNGCIAYYRPFPSGGHSAWAAGEDVTMTDVEGNSFTAKASQYECWLWFRRFDS